MVNELSAHTQVRGQRGERLPIHGQHQPQELAAARHCLDLQPRSLRTKGRWPALVSAHGTVPQHFSPLNTPANDIVR